MIYPSVGAFHLMASHVTITVKLQLLSCLVWGCLYHTLWLVSIFPMHIVLRTLITKKIMVLVQLHIVNVA